MGELRSEDTTEVAIGGSSEVRFEMWIRVITECWHEYGNGQCVRRAGALQQPGGAAGAWARGCLRPAEGTQGCDLPVEMRDVQIGQHACV